MEENKKTAIEKIYQLTKQDAEFNDELRKKLGITSSASSALIDDDRLNQIYEYCIEDILRKQADNFYDVFKNASFKENLVSDYIRMERFRRRNEFGDYALALYQQIETIINAIFMEPNFKDAVNSMWDKSFYKYVDKSNRTIVKTISSIVFGVDTIDKVVATFRTTTIMNIIYCLIQYGIYIHVGIPTIEILNKMKMKKYSLSCKMPHFLIFSSIGH